jgi:hypothetical protein
MSAYIFQMELPELTDEIAAKIPMHRDYVNKLFVEGRLISYSVSQSRNFIWCVLAAADEQEALEVISKFPLHPYFTDIMCHPLLFHNTQPASLPDISLN